MWAAYGFAWGRVTEQVPFLEGRLIPAPKIVDGLWQVHTHIEGGHVAYLLGRNSLHGWWYFFPVALAVKLPLGVLLLAAAGLYALRRDLRWEARAPALCAGAILAVCFAASLNIGVRYILAVFPMLAIMAGSGAVFLLERRGRVAPLFAAALLLWTTISVAAAHPGYLAYFNELAGSHPERVLVDSDLDWGQDMRQLALELRRRQVPFFRMACLYTGDDRLLGLPSWDTLEAYKPVTGWIAISFTMQKSYGWLLEQQQAKPEPAFAWLDRYQPVARVGKSILLYHIQSLTP